MSVALSPSRSTSLSGVHFSSMRETFCDAVAVVGRWSPGAQEPKIRLGNRWMPISLLCQHMVDSPDYMPCALADQVAALDEALPRPGTFGEGARSVLRLLQV